MDIKIMPLKEAIRQFNKMLQERPDVAEWKVGVYMVQGHKGKEDTNLILAMQPLSNEVEFMLAAGENGIKPLLGIGEATEFDKQGNPTNLAIENIVNVKDGKFDIQHVKDAKKGEDKTGKQTLFDLSKLKESLN